MLEDLIHFLKANQNIIIAFFSSLLVLEILIWLFYKSSPHPSPKNFEKDINQVLTEIDYIKRTLETNYPPQELPHDLLPFCAQLHKRVKKAK